MQKSSWYFRFSKAASRFAGRPIVFALAVVAIVVWAVTGPMFGFSDTWQLVINTGTTIVTFLMVFVIQNTKELDGFRDKYHALAAAARKAGNGGKQDTGSPEP